jgi:hypothetical protein
MEKANRMPAATLNSFHAFLIKHRIWCAKCSDLTPAVTVRRLNGAEEVLCNTHAGRLDAARISENKQTKLEPNLK